MAHCIYIVVMKSYTQVVESIFELNNRLQQEALFCFSKNAERSNLFFANLLISSTPVKVIELDRVVLVKGSQVAAVAVDS